MKKFAFSLLVFLSFNFISSGLYAQKFNGYKYVLIEDGVYTDGSLDKYGLDEQLRKFFKKNKFKVIRMDEDGEIIEGLPKHGNIFSCEVLWVESTHTIPKFKYDFGWVTEVTINLFDCNDDDEPKFSFKGRTGYSALGAKPAVKGAAKKALKNFESRMGKYKFNPNKTPTEN